MERDFKRELRKANTSLEIEKPELMEENHSAKLFLPHLTNWIM